jgi:DNA (cytosine-5)-methyltransferase 1
VTDPVKDMSLFKEVDGRVSPMGERGPIAKSQRPDWWSTEPSVGRVAHGGPSRVDRLRCLGNAVVPQVAQKVGEMILAAEKP